jgi:bis(5'-nucleosyl)-tetraphosphatase (symmetrical)
MPWFDIPNRQTASATLAFGHWSTLGWLGRDDALSMDTGCVWGGCLSALHFNLQDAAQELIQVQCEAEQKPGL